jgi:hypothetical protein
MLAAICRICESQWLLVSLTVLFAGGEEPLGERAAAGAAERPSAADGSSSRRWWRVLRFGRTAGHGWADLPLKALTLRGKNAGSAVSAVWKMGRNPKGLFGLATTRFPPPGYSPARGGHFAALGQTKAQFGR